MNKALPKPESLYCQASLMIRNWFKRSPSQVLTAVLWQFLLLTQHLHASLWLWPEPAPAKKWTIWNVASKRCAKQAFQWDRERGRERTLWIWPEYLSICTSVCECVRVCERVCVCVCIFNGGKCQNSQLTQRHVRRTVRQSARTLKYLLVYHVGSWWRRGICNLDTRSAYLDDYPAQQHLHLAPTSPRRANYLIMRWSWKLFIETSYFVQASLDMHVRVHYMCGQIEKLTDYTICLHNLLTICSSFSRYDDIGDLQVIFVIYIWHMIDRSINTRWQYEYIHSEYFGQYDTIPCVIIE